jgi:hypothetical protein
MCIKIIYALALSFTLSSAAHAAEGKFTLVPQDARVPFEATCFDTDASAYLLTFEGFLRRELSEKCEYEKGRLYLDYDMALTSERITLEETMSRYMIEIETRDIEIETLRNIVKKNKKINIPIVTATALATGFAIGAGSYYVVSK